jgi:hypothetical protein
MNPKKISKTRQTYLQLKLKQYTEDLLLYIQETVAEVTELVSLKRNHSFCVLSWNLLDSETQESLKTQGFFSLSNANFFLEAAVLHKLIEQRPPKLQKLHKAVLKTHIKLNGVPPKHVIEQFQ